MATVVDALIVTLGLDPKGFTEGQKKAAASFVKLREDSVKSTKATEASAKAAAQAFSKLRNEVLALTAALVGAAGIEQFIKRMTALDAATGRLSKNLGMSPANLDAFQGAVERVGGTAEEAASGISHLKSEAEKFSLTGSSEMIATLQALGRQTGVVIDINRPLEEQLAAIADMLKKVADEGDRAKAVEIGRMLGFGPNFVNVLLEGGDALQKTIDRQKQLANLTDADVAAAQRLQSAWHDLSRVLTDQGRKALTELTPVLSDLMDQFAAFIVANKQEIGQWARDLGKWLREIDWKEVRTGLSEFLGQIKSVTDAVGGLATAVEIFLGLWVGAKFAAMLGAVGVLNTALLPIVAALGTVYALDKLTGGAISRAGAELNAGLLNPDPNDPTNALIYGPGRGPALSAPENASNPGTPRGIRNNNPLNLGYRADQPGVLGSDGRFGRYATMEEGVAASQRQLSMYQAQSKKQGIPMTLERIITRWAPPSENDTAGYIAGVSKETGFKPNQALDVNDPAVATALIHAMARREVGRDLDTGTIARGVDRARGYSLGAGAAGVGGGSSTSSETNIGSITVNTQATDATGIAKDIDGAIRRRTSIGANFNGGLQ